MLEVEHGVIAVRPDADPVRVRRRTRLMRETFEDATVVGWEEVSAGLDLPDENDRHVLAAAITGGAQAIVTANLKDFPDEVLGPRGIEARHPDEFLLDQLDLFPSRVMEVLIEQAAHLRRPPMDLAGLLTALSRCGVQNFSEAVRRLAPEDL